MDESVLVAYATKYGSTREVAQAVVDSLKEQGLSVSLQPAGAIRSLEGYRAVVLGVPLYIGHWPKDAQRFLVQNQQALEKRPVAIFALGPTNEVEADWQGAREQLDQEIARLPWLKPAAVELFGGRYDPAKLRFPDSVLAKLPASPLYQAPAVDARDWDAIRGWAADLVTKI